MEAARRRSRGVCPHPQPNPAPAGRLGQGRMPFYEGYALGQVVFPVRVMRELGAGTLLVSNAAGGLNRQWNAGDLMVIADHMNFMGTNPLIGPNGEAFGARFPDMARPY